MHASIGDLVKYVQLYLAGGMGPDGPIVSSAALDEIETGRLEFYGFGWFSGRHADGVHAMWHNGSNGRFHSLIAIFPEERSAIIALTNQGPFPSDRVFELGRYLGEHFGLPVGGPIVEPK